MKAKSTYFGLLTILFVVLISMQSSWAQGTIIDNGSANKWVLHNPNDSRKFLVIAPGNGSSWNWGAAFNFFNDGSLCIGTAVKQSGYKLAVNGIIRAKEIRVNTGWSDFVFEEDYSLPTLSEVESHIKANKHLPGIPSAAEVEAEGVELGVISSKLLQKVEELTLYVIAQEKRIAALEAENKALRE